MTNPTRQPSTLLRATARISTHLAAALTTILWCAACGFYLCHLLPQLPDAPGSTFDFTETMLLAVSCLGFQLAALRVGLDHIAVIWNTTLDTAPTPAPPAPARWRIFGRLGAASWLAATIVGFCAVAGLWRPRPADLIFGLVIVLIPAVQCTGAAIIGPILTHVLQTRESAEAARSALIQVATATRERSHREV